MFQLGPLTMSGWFETPQRHVVDLFEHGNTVERPETQYFKNHLRKQWKHGGLPRHLQRNPKARSRGWLMTSRRGRSENQRNAWSKRCLMFILLGWSFQSDIDIDKIMVLRVWLSQQIRIDPTSRQGALRPFVLALQVDHFSVRRTSDIVEQGCFTTSWYLRISLRRSTSRWLTKCSSVWPQI